MTASYVQNVHVFLELINYTSCVRDYALFSRFYKYTIGLVKNIELDIQDSKMKSKLYTNRIGQVDIMSVQYTTVGKSILQMYLHTTIVKTCMLCIMLSVLDRHMYFIKIKIPTYNRSTTSIYKLHNVHILKK